MAVVLKPGMKVGHTSAEDDHVFLENCFIPTASVMAAKSMHDPRSIILGRTGSGKSALLWEIENTQQNVIRIDPEALSLSYISNSDIIPFFEKLDIKLDVFYQLLWRHVLVVEVIKAKKQLYDEAASRTWIAALVERFRTNPKKKQALEYLFEFGDSFWADTESRVREVVQNIEAKLQAESGIDVKSYLASLKGRTAAELAERIALTTEIVHKAQKVVDQVQIQRLNDVIELLATDVFADDQQRYYVIIDDLDKDWSHDRVRFKLIRALIETIRKFRRLRNVKIVISLRADLLHTVLKETASSGFQIEKYEDLFLRIRWSREDLVTLLSKRINYSFKDQYTSRSIDIFDVFSKSVGDQDSISYILDRTLDRPRDVIAFVNQCFEQAPGQTQITARVIRDAETAYSSKRLTYLSDEWHEVYGDLRPALRFLKELQARFTISALDAKMVDDLCLDVLQVGDDKVALSRECDALAGGHASSALIREAYLKSLYVIGALGVRVNKNGRFEWSYKNEPTLDFNRIDGDSTFAIHPMLFKALNVYADPKRIGP
jgi:hypothetical protein